MILSMTGYGSAKFENNEYSINVELKCLNSKFIDLNLRIPRFLSDKEIEIRGVLNNLLKRGKINANIELDFKENVNGNVQVNKDLFKQYFAEFKQLACEVGANEDELFKLALQSPEVLKVEEKEISEALISELMKVIEDAAISCSEFRADEGKRLQEELTQYCLNIDKELKAIQTYDPERLAKIKQRIRQNVDELAADIDENRFEQEIIYYAEKLDITEEIIRLDNHIRYFIKTMEERESNGKKLGFISQEMGREINTLGSKANDAFMQNMVVKMKDELEKIKEQSLNIL
jgi:uncharacterized protein (TIGR00255 family)